MTTVGKILVVLQVVLSIMFMAFAGAVFTAQRNWMSEATKLKDALAKANTKLSDQQSAFETERRDTKQKMDAQANQVTTLKGEKDSLTTQVATLDADNKRLTLALDGVKDQALLTGVEADERKKEADIQREQNSMLFGTREELIKELHEQKDKVFSLDIQIQQLVERHEKVLNDLKTIKLYNASKGWPTDPKDMVAQSSPPPPLDGEIVEHRKEAKSRSELVEISLGSDDGLSVGHKMTIYNNEGRYLGKIRISYVEPDKAVGIVTEKAKNIVIQKGDHVTTKL
jgi:chromosome segregation ATPase